MQFLGKCWFTECKGRVLGVAGHAEVAVWSSMSILFNPPPPALLSPFILGNHSSEICLLFHGRKPGKDPVLVSIMIKDKTTKLNWKQSLHYTSLHTPKILKTKEVQGKPITIGKEGKNISGLKLLLFLNSELKYFNSSTTKSCRNSESFEGALRVDVPWVDLGNDIIPEQSCPQLLSGLSGAAVCRCSQGDVVTSQRENATWQGEDAEEIQTVFQHSESSFPKKKQPKKHPKKVETLKD